MKFEDMTYEDVVTHIETLMAVKEDSLDTEALRSMTIFSALERLYVVHFKKLRVLMRQQEKVALTRWKRYAGKWSAAQYKEEPLAEAILKGDIDKYLAVDQVLVEINHLVEEQDKLVKHIEAAKGMIRQRGFDIKNALEFRKFMAGA